CATGTGYW
nr:immunoglobulin heavy chain junction region [Mus musculus]NSM06494.1 immunoglobulin heavy chain junction region [Mus musculus]NSM08448.1 immunoglobulin heavy chain junction region [Mus musculus]